MTARPQFHVLEIAPGPKTGLWVYVSVGASDVPQPDRQHEFLLCTSSPSDRAVELVTMIAWYHSTRGLGLGHTLPIGEPWLPGATCDHFLLSAPYPFGPSLESVEASSVRILWLLPVTKAERDFKVSKGVEALEELFDSQGIEYWNPMRPSVVAAPDE